MSQLESIDIIEVGRQHARHLIADVTQPMTWVTDAFDSLLNSLKGGDLCGAAAAAFSHGATLMVEEVKRECPTDTGTLRDSIYASTEEVPSSLSVPNTFAYVTTDEDYAFYIEYGTSKMPAQPFMRPGRDKGMDRVLLAIGDWFVTSVVTAFWGRLAITYVDVGLKHAAKGKQDRSLGADLAIVTTQAVAGHIIGKVGSKIGGAVFNRGTGRAAAGSLRVSAKVKGVRVGVNIRHSAIKAGAKRAAKAVKGVRARGQAHRAPRKRKP